MTNEIPPYALRAYAMVYTKFGTAQFTQSALDWIIGTSMKKKIFATLVHGGWIKKTSRRGYVCVSVDKIMHQLLEFKVPNIIQKAERPYAFTGLSAVEIWSDFCYVQRSRERSPYFIKIMRKDLKYWKNFFNRQSIPNYIGKGSTIGEFAILMPEKEVKNERKNGMLVEPLKKTMEIAKTNEMYAYACKYMRKKYGIAAS